MGPIRHLCVVDAYTAKVLVAMLDVETDVQQSLLMWVQNTLKAYPSIKVTNFTKSWHNGMAFCALIHKFRPKVRLSSEQVDGVYVC